MSTSTRKRANRAQTKREKNPSQDLAYIAPGLRHLAVPISELAQMVGNPRSHPAENLQAIKAALQEYGQVETILVNRRKRPWEVIHGNGRLRGALDLGWTHVAANIIDVDDATAKAMAVVLNRTGELATWNKEELDKLLREVQTSEKLNAMLADLAKQEGLDLDDAAPEDPGPQLDKAAELQKKWKTERGQLWLIPSKTVPPRKVVKCPCCAEETEVA